MFKQFFVLIYLSLSFVLSVNAGSLGAADGYNVFVFGSLQSSSDIGGRVAAGTTISGNFDIGAQLTSSPANFDVVAGSGLAANAQIKVESSGKTYVPNGQLGSNVLMNGGGSLVTAGPDPVDFSSAQSQFQLLSANLSSLSATGTIGSGIINATSSGQNVFDLSAAEFMTLTNIYTDGGTVIINVAGTPGQNTNNMFVNGQQNTAGSTVASKVLFNFYQDKNTVTLGNSFGGSVLAPWATVTGASDYNGTIIADALDFTGEIHADGLFDAPPTFTPEPSAFVLATIGLVGLVMWRRSSRVGPALRNDCLGRRNV